MSVPELSTKTAAALPVGEVLRCHVVPGLELWAKSSGKFWFLYYRTSRGERRRPKLAQSGYPTVGIEAARQMAKEWLQRVARGEDPSAERTEKRHAPTVADLAKLYGDHKSTVNKPRTMEELRRHLNLHIVPEIGTMRVAEVEQRDVERVLEAVRARKRTKPPKTEAGARARVAPAHGAANGVRETMRGLFNFAARPSLKWRPKDDNPVAETVRIKLRARRTHMTEDQFRAVGAALQGLAAEYPVRVAALLCILLCGSRVTELVTAKCSQYDGAKITLDEHKTDRTGEVREIHVPQQARELIARLPLEADRVYLFGDLDRYAVFHVWEQAREIAGCPEVQVRDFRRTFASIALSTGQANLDQIGELFGHRDTKTTKGYAWMTDRAATEATQGVADTMSDLKLIAAPKDGAK